MKTVNAQHLSLYLDGCFLSQGVIVNEAMCEEALKALEAGDKVLVVDDNGLTGTALVQRGNDIYEEEG